MSEKKSLIIIVVVLVTLIGLSVVAYNKFSEGFNNGLASGTSLDASSDDDEYSQYIDCELEDRNGKKVKLSDIKDKPIVLNFWASWCGPCKNEMPDFDEVYKEYGKEVEFIMVNLTDGAQETKITASNFINKEGYSFSIYFDVEQEGAKAYSVMSIPVTYFINKKGEIVSYRKGSIDKNTLLEGIKGIK